LSGLAFLFVFAFSAAPVAAPTPATYTTAPFAVDLWDDAPPTSARPVTKTNPLRLTAACGETESALLVLKARADHPWLKIKPGPLKRAEHAIDRGFVHVRVVRSVRRATPYAALPGARFPGRYTRREGIRLPDILAADEPAIARAARNWPGRLPDEKEDAPALTTPVRAGRFKYVLVTVRVPKKAAPGQYEGTLSVSAVARLLASPDAAMRRRGTALRERLLETLAPYESLMPGGKRIDLASSDPESGPARTREGLARIIVEAAKE